MAEPDRVPRLARPFVALLIAAMVASAVFVWEPWPLTSFGPYREWSVCTSA
jgi:hypothetical protein